MSARKRKQEVQDKGGEARKRRKGEDGKAAVPDSKLDKSPKKQNGNTPDTTLQTTVPIVAPQVKVGKKAVVLNQNWNKVKSTLPPTNPARQRRLELRRKQEAEEKQKAEQEERKKKGKKEPPVTLPVSDSLEPTKVLALDCEMVGVGIAGFDSALARVTILNSYGNTIYDKFVQPQEPVVDYRTKWSGIRPEDLEGAPSFQVVQKEVADLIKGRIVVGHGLKSDFKAMLLHHPFSHIRDTARYRPLQRKKGRPYSLKVLTKQLLGVEIQSGEHDSGEDARAALLLYKKYKADWEKQIENSRYQPKKKKKTVVPGDEEKKL